MTALPPFQTVLDEHRGDVYRYLTASLGPADADDCFQETCLAALRAYPRLRHADHLRAWLFRIAEHKAVDVHRARMRRELPSDELPERGAEDPGPAGQSGLFEQVRLLPHKQRAAVVLRCVLALSGHQVDLPPDWPGGDRLAVHATRDVSSIGKPVSLGCMRTQSKQARWLIDTIPLGSPIFIGA